MARVTELHYHIIHPLRECRLPYEAGNELVNPTTLMGAFAEQDDVVIPKAIEEGSDWIPLLCRAGGAGAEGTGQEYEWTV